MSLRQMYICKLKMVGFQLLDYCRRVMLKGSLLELLILYNVTITIRFFSIFHLNILILPCLATLPAKVNTQHTYIHTHTHTHIHPHPRKFALRSSLSNCFDLIAPSLHLHCNNSCNVGKSKGGAYGDNVEEMDWQVGEVIKVAIALT